jgi:uncharacterized protein YkwD
MRRLAAAAILLLAAGAGAQVQGDVMPRIAQVRANGCAGHAGARQPLRWSESVARAAAHVAHGEKPLAALEREGYRATRVFHASFSGYKTSSDVADALAKNYCAALTEPAFTDIGLHRAGSKWFALLTAPLEVPQLEDRRAALGAVLALINEARAHARRCGAQAFGAAPPLRWNAQLEQAAARHAQDMAAHAYLDHRGRDGSSPPERVTRSGYRWRSVGENVASGQTTPRDVVDDWLRSPGHCANLMSPDFTEVGVAYAVNMKAEAVVYWAQAFGRPR